MYVPGIGPRNARIAIVGEAPGESEAARGEPFVGSSGQLLNQMLAAVGISRGECYLTNVVKQRPPANNFDTYYVDGSKRKQPSTYLETSIKELHSELTAIKPNVIVPLGGEALRAITGRLSIEKWRGSIISSPVGKCVGTYHPSYVLRQYTARPIVEFDLRRVLEEAATPSITLPTHQFITRPSFADVMIFIEKAMTQEFLSFDIETSGNLVRCLGLSYDKSSAICIPFIRNPNEVHAGSTKLFVGDVALGGSGASYWSVAEEQQILNSLWRLFQNPKIKKVAQNAPFDLACLHREFGLWIRNLWMDTMVAWHNCYSELPKGLDFLCSILTRVPYYSDYDVRSDQSTWLYNCYDAAVTLEIAERLDEELRDLGLTDFYFRHTNPAITAVTRCEQRGVRIDVERRREHAAYIRQVVDESVKQMREITGIATFNPNSPKQVSEYLYGKLKLKPETKRDSKTKEWRTTTDKHAILALSRKYPAHIAFFRAMQEFSEKETLLSGFLEKPLGTDGRIRTHYNIAGTETRRWSSSEPLFEEGTNLQNIPVRTAEGAKIRQTFVADVGWWLLKADLSQAEFRIVMWDAAIRRVIDRYLYDPTFDCHKWVASLIYRKPEDQITKAERSDGKNGVYGGNYGMYYKRAAMVYKIPEDKAKFVLEAYRKELWEVPQWWLKVQANVSATRRIISPTGGSRFFFNRMDEDLFRVAYSHTAQSIVGDLITRAFTLADEIMNPDECYPLLQTHDEILFHCRKGYVRKYLPVIKNLMEYPLYFDGVPEPLIIPSDPTYGDNWYDQKEIPEGVEL